MTAHAPLTVHVDTAAMVEKLKTWLRGQFLHRVRRAQLDVGSICCRENTRVDCGGCGVTLRHWDLDVDHHVIDVAEVIAAVIGHTCPAPDTT